MADPSPTAPPPPASIDSAFRNGSLTAYSVVVGFSLSFLTRWAGLPGEWFAYDLLALASIILGIGAQIVALAWLLSTRSLLVRNYNRSVRLFLAGLGLVCLGVLLAIGGDLVGLGQRVLRG